MGPPVSEAGVGWTSCDCCVGGGEGWRAGAGDSGSGAGDGSGGGAGVPLDGGGGGARRRGAALGAVRFPPTAELISVDIATVLLHTCKGGCSRGISSQGGGRELKM